MALPVQARLTRHNHNSLAAVLAVLEAEVPAGLLDVRLTSAAPPGSARGLVLYSFTTRGLASVSTEVSTLRRHAGPGLYLVAGGCHATASPEDTLCCVESNGTCTSSADCCGWMSCVAGRCACQPGSDICADTDDCCAGLSCSGDSCTSATADPCADSSACDATIQRSRGN